MANRYFPGKVMTAYPGEVKLHFVVIADAATDYLEWPDGTAIVSTHNGDPANDPRNRGIKYIARTGAGAYTVYLQDSYAYLLNADVKVGDESTTDDKAVGLTITADDVDGSTPYFSFTLYDDAGNAQEVTDGNYIYGSIELLNNKF